jgi:hypothetical protein
MESPPAPIICDWCRDAPVAGRYGPNICAACRGELAADAREDQPEPAAGQDERPAATPQRRSWWKFWAG